ncbi:MULTISPECIES: glycoside hydrolase family 65 protein [unclassified Paenibacillus]|uniref:glycoside hydrolase family 65 protein n=1 Tax=unclassified Paenibacillus TaxID=185978 RepID=UPI001C107951|nr:MULTISPECIES: glycosyl hydrolase family 65 protein [unclassified Paenibacillus]MBU5444760.1 glycoside hydrolase family 65 protein [Paenibacillus sp. MSJ-34]CAH0119335.1 Kojibiose phosphorylase [Paenibacillus sp. CECT 9249]
MLTYDAGQGERKNWIVAEMRFDVRHLAKYETIMCLGNGYMGVRSCTEERYAGETRNCFVAGTFNKFDEREVTELPNCADMTELDITINGETFHLEKGRIHRYIRQLNLRTGELTRSLVWENNEGEAFEFVFRRFVSLRNLHLFGMRAEIVPLTGEAEIAIRSGINGQVTNSGAQHFHEGDKRIFDKKLLQMTATTTESNIDFAFTCTHRHRIGERDMEPEPRLSIGRRKVAVEYRYKLAVGEKITLEKIGGIYTSLDREFAACGAAELRERALIDLQTEAAKGYEQLLLESAEEWSRKWEKADIRIESAHDFDQLAVRFAQYHLVLMTPAHDNRFGVGAKGLSGEGYKGHSFWDTEIFIMPYFLFTEPETARKLLEYRYNTLAGARRKAQANGFRGAMYPWESALTGDEATPDWGPVDVVTGTPTRIWTGAIEQHITSDVAYGVWQYYRTTGDERFMERCGYEIVMETATFWASRLEWDEAAGRYHINDVIGPDEYKEHVDNNAFTNYMAHWNIRTAIACHDKLRQERPELWSRLNEALHLEEACREWKAKADLIYLPQPRAEDLIIPQDDTYLHKKIINLTKYRNQREVGLIFEDYNMDQVSDMQVSKQADIMVLFYLLEHLFPREVKRANWNYYEPKTLHDSSLSMSTHCVLACDMDDTALAYRMFEQAARIDLGPNMKSSDQGMHTASIGGIWKSAVFGFGGVRSLDGKLRIDPRLPKEWESLAFPLYWQGDRLQVRIVQGRLEIVKETGVRPYVEFTVHGKPYTLKDRLEIALGQGEV